MVTVLWADRNIPWWCHQTETFSELLVICERNPPVSGEFPSPRPMTQSFDVFFDLRLKSGWAKWLRRRWFETHWRSLWRHCNAELHAWPISISSFRLASIHELPLWVWDGHKVALYPISYYWSAMEPWQDCSASIYSRWFIYALLELETYFSVICDKQ